MHGPPVLGWLLVAVCALAAMVCLARARAPGSPARERQVSASEAVMGAGMAAMAVPGAPAPSWLLLAVFALVALWSVRLLLCRARHQLHHLLEAGAMLYMTLAMPPLATGAGHAGHGGQPGGVPLVTGALALYFTLYALRAAARLAPAPAAPALAGPAPTAPGPAPRTGGAPRLVDRGEVGTACRLTLAMGMAAMLVTL